MPIAVAFEDFDGARLRVDQAGDIDAMGEIEAALCKLAVHRLVRGSHFNGERGR